MIYHHDNLQRVIVEGRDVGNNGDSDIVVGSYRDDILYKACNKLRFYVVRLRSYIIIYWF